MRRSATTSGFLLLTAERCWCWVTLGVAAALTLATVVLDELSAAAAQHPFFPTLCCAGRDGLTELRLRAGLHPPCLVNHTSTASATAAS